MPKKILIVDDEKDVQSYFKTMLEDNGYQTASASDGVEAMEKARSGAFDLVMLDITMPNKSGVRVYRELKEEDGLKKIPVLIVSGVPHEFKRFISTRTQVPPPDGYLEKPVALDDVLAEVRRIIG